MSWENLGRRLVEQRLNPRPIPPDPFDAAEAEWRRRGTERTIYDAVAPWDSELPDRTDGGPREYETVDEEAYRSQGLGRGQAGDWRVDHDYHRAHR